MKLAEVARMVHQTDKAYCESIGDYSNKNWEQAEPADKKRMEDIVQFYTDNPLAMDCSIHNVWIKAMVMDGWVKGDEFNPFTKTHPGIIKFEEIPFEQQVRATIIRRVIGTLGSLLEKTSENLQ